jgi:hypothetical protein
MNTLIRSIEGEYVRYKALAEAALAQVPDAALSEPGPGNGNSLAIICWHLSGNLKSRFTDFLTSDGEKPWRNREEEFAARAVTRAELLEKWNDGWGMLLATLRDLSDDDLNRTITIRGQPHEVHEALSRSLAHASYHVGQIVYVAHSIVGEDWRYLSIVPGGSAAFNASSPNQKPLAHARTLNQLR